MVPARSLVVSVKVADAVTVPAVAYECGPNGIFVGPLLAAVAGTVELAPSPQFSVPLRLSPAVAEQLSIPVMLIPTCTVVSLSVKVHIGGTAVVVTVTATDAGVTEPEAFSVLSVTVALTG